MNTALPRAIPYSQTSPTVCGTAYLLAVLFRFRGSRPTLLAGKQCNAILASASIILVMCFSADTHAGSAPFVFRDAADHQGRSMLHYRAIEFGDAPVQPLAGEFSPTPGAVYGQIPVGLVPESALAVVWLPKSDDGPILWFDADGDGTLTVAERYVVPGREIEILATITVQMESQVERVSRTILFRRPAFGAGLRYAVRGYAVGSLNFTGTRHSALLVDGNADGCLDTVGHDRVWIDLNGDGRFDGLTEQFPLGKPVVKGGRVYVIRSDPLAHAVSANLRIPGEGILRLTLARNLIVTKLSVELVSDLGELVAIDRLDEPVPVPHGKFRVSWVKLQVTGLDGQQWYYSFSRSKQKYYSVPIGKETMIPLLGQFAMQVNLALSRGRAKPSETITVRPRVIADGETLYLSSCTRGSEDRTCAAEGSAEILLLAPNGEAVSRGLSGFS